MKSEVVIVTVSAVILFAAIAAGVVFIVLELPLWAFFLSAGAGFVQFIVCMMLAVRIEQVAGFYECGECGGRYVPSYKAVCLAVHMGRTRYMKCPYCGKKSWQKKVPGEEPADNGAGEVI